MRVELEENCVTLLAESEWEKKALKQIHKNGVKRVQYTDAWEQAGGLRLESVSEKEHWGR